MEKDQKNVLPNAFCPDVVNDILSAIKSFSQSGYMPPSLIASSRDFSIFSIKKLSTEISLFS